jgi:hypothetical protein
VTVMTKDLAVMTAQRHLGSAGHDQTARGPVMTGPWRGHGHGRPWLGHERP